MFIIKLNAIESTNDYLKQLNRNHALENFTTIVAESQTDGKGQMGSKWISQSGKNLTFSVLSKDFSLDNKSYFDYNVVVSVSLFEVLESLKIPNLNIKWPNDILAENKKIAGILIENIIKADGTKDSVIGIGLNVNQEDFSMLPNATSLKNVSNRTFDLDDLLEKITKQIENNVLQLETKRSSFWDYYLQNIYKINEQMNFEDQNKNIFSGIIKTVTTEGKLAVKIEEIEIQYFGLKEIKMLY